MKMKKVLALSFALAAAVGSVQAQTALKQYPAYNAVDNAFGDIGMPRSSGGAIWTDYDGDGELDVLIFGGTWSTPDELGAVASKPMPKLFKGNQTTQTYTDVTTTVFGEAFKHEFVRGSAVWLDYNKDGAVDLLMMGDLEGNKKEGNGNGSYFYKGSGTGTAFKLTLDPTISAQFPANVQSGEWGVSSRIIQIADFNGDGFDDVLFTVKDVAANKSIFALYKNKGDGTGFEPVDKPVNGTENFRQLSTGSIAIADYNADGKLDIMFSGDDSIRGQHMEYLAGYYKGKGGFEFEPAVYFPDVKLRCGELAWIDFDKDGDLDAVLTGEGGIKESADDEDVTNFVYWRTAVFKNNGASGFEQVFNHGLDGAKASSVAVGDLNMDGYDDIVIMGENAYKAYYNNHGNEGNLFVGRSTSFNLTGNTNNGMVSILDLNKDGKNDVIIVGEGGVSKPTIFYNMYPTLEYLPPMAPAPFAVQPITFQKVDKPLRDATGAPVDFPQITSGDDGISTAWGDYNNDGLLDLLIWGSRGKESNTKPFTHLYQNQGNGTFKDVTGAKLGASFKYGRGSMAWVDYNRDGNLDLVVAASKEGNPMDNIVTMIYRNAGDLKDYSLEHDPLVTFALPVHGEKQVGVQRAINVADYNNDGYPDLLMNGIAKIPNANPNEKALSRRCMLLYKNVPHSNGINRAFEMQDTTKGSGTELFKVSGSMVAWGDYNNDGELDILFNGWRDGAAAGTSPMIAGIFKNNGDGTFTQLPAEQTPFKASENGEITWLDYNKDGWQDVLIMGEHNHGSGTDWEHASLYKNKGDGTGFVEIKTSNLKGTPKGSLSVADFNNDGYPEVAITGEWGSYMYYYKDTLVISESHPDSMAHFPYRMDDKTFTYVTSRDTSKTDGKITVNTSNRFANGTVSMVDANNDGRLDILVLGVNQTSLLLNVDGPVATKPAKPANLKQVLSEGELALSWTKVDNAIGYNLFIYDKTKGFGDFGAMASHYMAMDTSGVVKVGMEGNFTLLRGNFATFKGLNLDTADITWGVVAIAANKTSSELAVYGKSEGGGSTAVSKAALGSFKVFKRGGALVAATDIAAENAELAVFNLMGAKVWSKNGCFLGETEISGLPQGMYFVVIRVGNEIMVEKAIQ